jgi:hypothetical protein
MVKEKFPTDLDLATRSDDIHLRSDLEEFSEQQSQERSSISLSERTRHSLVTHEFMQAIIRSQPIYPIKYG